MIKAVLFDLDDTLLGNNIDTFMEGYFGLLGAHASEFMDAQTFIQELLICTQAMMADTNQVQPSKIAVSALTPRHLAPDRPRGILGMTHRRKPWNTRED